MKKIKNYLNLSILIILIFLLLVLKYWPDKYTHIIFCDVGQGDAILITSGFTQILVDSGLGKEVNHCLGEHMPFWDKQLELIVATHADSDHIGGFPDVLESYKVKNIILPQVGDSGEAFKKLHRSILGEKTNLERVELANFGSKIVLSSISRAQILWPILDKVSRNDDSLAWERGESEEILEDILLNLNDKKKAKINKNDGSIVLLFSVGKIDFLLTGDLETKGEQSLLSAGLIKKAHVLKAGHHGSKTSSSLGFLERIQPEKIVVSSGKNNSYGHPSPEVLDRFEEIGAKILRTDEMGSIEFMSDGDKYWLAD